MEILNIDELATPATKKVVISGNEYAVEEMTVQVFIDASLATKKLDEDPNATEGERIEQMVDMVSSLIPSCPKEVLTKLEFKQINALVAFCRGVLASEIKKTYGSVETTDKKGEQKKGARRGA